MAMLEMAVHDFPKKPGVYTLIVEVAQPIKKKIGKLGVHNFPRGFYTYTGSAIGLRSLNLRTRIKRHLALRKKEHWHIDYLLNSEVTRISAVIYIETHSKIECQIARKLGGLNGGNIIVEGFGSSDCHEGCESHLHYFEINFEELSVKVVELYEAFGSPRLLIFGNE